MTYMAYIRELITEIPVGAPIYTGKIAEKLADHFEMGAEAAAAATAVTVKRLLDGGTVPDLRCYQKGIYFRTVATPFGERGIDRERLIADKYLLPDKGYETGPAFLHRLGLTTQIPKERVIASNAAGECSRKDKKLNVTIRPPKVNVNADNKSYLQTLDALELLDKAPVDAERPYAIIANHIQKNDLRYENLLFFADRYYKKNTIIQLAHTAGEGGILP